MAEVIGAVSGVIGIAGVAVQFAESIRKLYVFCKDAHQAPEELRRGTNELQLLSHILDGMAVQLQQNHAILAQHAGLPAILEACRQGQTETSQLLSCLEDKVSKKKGAVKAVLKQKDVQHSLDRIERAKSSLLIAQCVYNGGFMNQGFNTITTRLERLEVSLVRSNLSTTQMTIAHNKQGAIPAAKSVDIDDLCVNNDGNDDCAKAIMAPRRKYGRPITSTRLIFQPLPWLVERTWDFAFERASQGWSIHFKMYKTIPRYSRFFHACWAADLDQIRLMIAAGSASVLDRDEDGNDPFYYLLDGITYKMPNGENIYVKTAQYLLSMDLHVSIEQLFYAFGSRPQHQYIHNASSIVQLFSVVTTEVDV